MDVKQVSIATMPPKKRVIRNILPASEVAICARVRESRQRLGFTQIKFASQLGITRAALASYEDARAPIKAAIALKLCHQFIISEEWLATGKHSSWKAEAIKHRIPPGPGMEELEREIFLRQSMDLFSELSALQIAPGTLFSEAYRDILASRYADLAKQHFYFPRVSFMDSDESDLALNFLIVINERHILLLRNEALRRQLMPAAAWRFYTRRVFEASNLIFKKMMGFRSSSEEMKALEWLRYISSEPSAKINFAESQDGSRSHARSPRPPILQSN